MPNDPKDLDRLLALLSGVEHNARELERLTVEIAGLQAVVAAMMAIGGFDAAEIEARAKSAINAQTDEGRGKQEEAISRFLAEGLRPAGRLQ